MTDQELDEIMILRWPGVVRRIMADLDASEFTKGFARSISKFGKKPDWHPSKKQERLMRTLLTEYGSGYPERTPDLLE